MHPNQMSESQQAGEFRGWFHAFERLGITVLFSDSPPAVTLIPVSMASGSALQQACLKLGQDLVAYSRQLAAAEAPPPAPAYDGAPIPSGADDRIGRLEAMMAQIAAGLGTGAPPVPHRFVDAGPPEPQGSNRGVNHEFTQPVAGEHAPAPVAPRIMSGKS